MSVTFPAIFAGEPLQLSSWWHEIDNSVVWQESIYFSLSAAYALTAMLALTLYIRFYNYYPRPDPRPEVNWNRNQVFNLMNFIVNTARAILFALHKMVFRLHPKVLTLVLLDFPGLVFFSTYTLIILAWAELYYLAKAFPTDKLKPLYYSTNAALYFIQVCIWVYLWMYENSTAEFIGKIFVAVVSLVAASGFLLYGGRMFRLLWLLWKRSSGTGRPRKLIEVGSMTPICFICFLIRSIVVVVSAYDSHVSLYVLDQPVLNLIYYTLVEILPSALGLYILRARLPPRLEVE